MCYICVWVHSWIPEVRGCLWGMALLTIEELTCLNLYISELFGLLLLGLLAKIKCELLGLKSQGYRTLLWQMWDRLQANFENIDSLEHCFTKLLLIREQHIVIILKPNLAGLLWTKNDFYIFKWPIEKNQKKNIKIKTVFCDVKFMQSSNFSANI